MESRTMNKALQRLDVLVGTWDMHASIGDRPMGESRATFGWHQSHGYLTMHVDPPTDIAPEWQQNSPLPIDAAIGYDEHSGSFTMLYSDARAVCRVYQMAFEGDRWTMQGQAADGFHQRFVAIVDATRGRIEARWEHAEDGESWRSDFDVTYVKQDTTSVSSVSGRV
ncbi:hypothetical protein AB0E69_26305 [Kribbella sp. NPDC026611]|uniref:hypothetical protein n=1 Tax=Kribbella sp. NPDC026611 TaxID=3154911 RepID=UPI0034107215